MSTLPSIPPPSDAAAAAAADELARKTRPRGSLGRLETLAIQLASIWGRIEEPRAALVVAAADHGYAEEAVSAYPAEVTRQMLLNYANGGAAVCVLARETGARLVVVDAGVLEAVDHPALRNSRIAAGTANAARGAAMTLDQAHAAVDAGVALARELAADGVNVLGIGEMGIANTTAASALHAALLGVPAAEVCGPGSGLDDDGVRHKAAVVERALAANAPLASEGIAVVAAVGGFEIAFLAGVAIGAASERVGVLVDGFISGSAALVAARIAPEVVPYLIASHLSPEPGHRLALEDLGLHPLLDLELRLGEGTGAALALPLVRAAVAIHDEMATFAAAGVTDAGR